jgi:isopentenyldiphosphate isomerase
LDVDPWAERTNPELVALRLEALERGDAAEAARLAAVVAERIRRHETGERLEVFDDSLRPCGVKERGRVHLDGDWHRSLHVWILSRPRAAVLVQRRAETKETYPGALDASVGGHYRAGEGAEALVREAQEELGLALDPAALVPLGRAVDMARHGYLIDREVADVFLAVGAFAPGDLRPDPTEVAEVVELPVAAGLALFAGGAARVSAWAYPAGGGPPRPVVVEAGAFTTHHDRYYARLFLQADRVLRGEAPLPV